MRYFVLLLVGMVLFGGCKKAVEQQQLNALMELITNGQWKVTSFKQDANDITSRFTPYSFQFKRNETVDAIKNGTIEKTGTWVGNTSNGTIQSSFGAVQEPLNLLNGTWQITKTSTTFVEANQHINAEVRTLRLDKL